MEELLFYFRHHSFNGFLHLVISAIRSRLLFKNARLIRFPIRVRGKQFIEVNKGFTTGFNCRLDAYPKDSGVNKCIQIGENVQINDNVHIASVKSVIIGDNVLIASKVYISDHDHGTYAGDGKHDSPYSVPKERGLQSLPVRISNNVWIGQNVSILKGVSIGFGSIIGSNSVVTKDIPPMTIALGTPAKIVKRFNEKSQKWETVR